MGAIKESGGRRKGVKGISPRLAPERVYLSLPKDMIEWLRGYSESQKKSVSLIIMEALERERERVLSQSV